jgi:hypothetical protein
MNRFAGQVALVTGGSDRRRWTGSVRRPTRLRSRGDEGRRHRGTGREQLREYLTVEPRFDEMLGAQPLAGGFAASVDGDDALGTRALGRPFRGWLASASPCKGALPGRRRRSPVSAA